MTNIPLHDNDGIICDKKLLNNVNRIGTYQSIQEDMIIIVKYWFTNNVFFHNETYGHHIILYGFKKE